MTCPRKTLSIGSVALGIVASFLVASSFPTFAQSSDTVLTWESRVDLIASGIAVDLSKLEAYDKTIGYARLGDTLWKRNEETGKDWLVRATDFAISPASDFKDLKERLTAQRELLKILAGKDVILARKLVQKMTQIGHELGEKDEETNNETILKAATAMVGVDSKSAFDLAMGTLKSRNPSFSFSSLIFSLRLASKNSSLANDYFAGALELVARRPTQSSYTNLLRSTFPGSFGDSHSSFVNDLNQRRLLEVLVGQFTTESREVLEGRSDCAMVRSFAAKLLQQFEAIHPEKVSLVEYAMSSCGTKVSEVEKKTEAPPTPLTVEELMDLAENSTDIGKKTDYLWKASTKAIAEKKYKIAFEALLKMDSSARLKTPGMWEATLIQAVGPLAIERVRENDYAALNSIYSRTPVESRPLIRIESAYRLKKDTHRLLMKEILDQTRKELPKANYKPLKNVNVLLSSPELYSAVLNLYLKIDLSSDALDTLEESVPEINRYLSFVPEEERRRDISSLPITWGKFADFDGEFLDLHYLRIEAVLSKIEYRPVRLDVNYSWLKSSVKRLIEIKEIVAKKKQAESMKTNPLLRK